MKESTAGADASVEALVLKPITTCLAYSSLLVLALLKNGKWSTVIFAKKSSKSACPSNKKVMAAAETLQLCSSFITLAVLEEDSLQRTLPDSLLFLSFWYLQSQWRIGGNKRTIGMHLRKHADFNYDLLTLTILQYSMHTLTSLIRFKQHHS